MSNLLLFAAGSLRVAFGPLLAAFQAQTGEVVDAVFGPAGLLRQRIEAGERPHVFASANLAHPQRLVDLHLSPRVQTFARNRLCATVRNSAGLTERPLLEVLLDSRWRVATSTPGADPSGDYALQLFERIESLLPGQGTALRQRALALVGAQIRRRCRWTDRRLSICSTAGRRISSSVTPAMVRRWQGFPSWWCGSYRLR